MRQIIIRPPLSRVAVFSFIPSLVVALMFLADFAVKAAKTSLMMLY